MARATTAETAMLRPMLMEMMKNSTCAAKPTPAVSAG
jgi:hypothetical protein